MQEENITIEKGSYRIELNLNGHSYEFQLLKQSDQNITSCQQRQIQIITDRTLQ